MRIAKIIEGTTEGRARTIARLRAAGIVCGEGGGRTWWLTVGDYLTPAVVGDGSVSIRLKFPGHASGAREDETSRAIFAVRKTGPFAWVVDAIKQGHVAFHTYVGAVEAKRIADEARALAERKRAYLKGMQEFEPERYAREKAELEK